MLNRIKKLFTIPPKLIWAHLFPVSYAKSLGVEMNGQVTIYGTSYYMFSSEPYLVTLGDNVFISLDARFVCHDGGVLPFRKEYPKLDISAPISVGNNVFIGMRACILPGVSIGDNCIIGAYALVTKDVPSGSIVGGNPAKFIKPVDDYIKGAREKSIEIGHLSGREKVEAYKTIFNK